MTKIGQIVVLTGVSGFLGSWLARGLLEAGYQIKGVRRCVSTMHRVADIEEKITWLDIDTATDEDLISFLQGANAIIHTAGSYSRRGESIAYTVEANLVFGLRLLEATINSGVPCFINSATALPRVTNVYTRSKAQFSEWGRSLANVHSLMFIDVLLEHMYGPGDDAVKFVEYVIESCINNQQELELTHGIQKRDFIYIGDVVSAYLTLVEKSKDLGSAGYYEVPLGSGELVPVRSLVELIHSITGSSTKLLFGAKKSNPTEVMYSCANTALLRSLGWEAHVRLQEGLELAINERRLLCRNRRC